MAHEQFIGLGNRDLLDHIIVLDEYHLRRLMNSYVRYYHEDRTHLGLAKETHANRRPERNPATTCRVVSLPPPWRSASSLSPCSLNWSLPDWSSLAIDGDSQNCTPTPNFWNALGPFDVTVALE